MRIKTKLGWLLMPLALALPAATARADAPRLVGDWRLDEGAGGVVHDSSGSRIEGTIGVGAEAPAWVQGVAGSALEFDGDDQVTLRDSAALAPARVTVAAWVRHAGSPGAYSYIFAKNSSSCFRGSYGLYSGSSGGAALYVAGDGAYTVSPQAPPEAIWDGRWHRLAGTYDGRTVRLYVDGAEVRDGARGPTHIDYELPGHTAYIGNYRDPSCALPFTGDIDSLRVWNGALNAAGIVADARPPARPPSKPPGSSTPPPTQQGSSTPPPVGRAPGSPAVSKGSTPGRTSAAPGCTWLRVSRRMIRVGRRARIRVTVRRSGRRVRHARVLLRAHRLHRALRTNRHGRGRFVVRPTRRQHRLTVRVKAHVPPARCSAPKAIIRVRR